MNDRLYVRIELLYEALKVAKEGLNTIKDQDIKMV